METNFIYKEFGLRLRTARKAAGLTQEALADWVGLSRTSITNIEKGRQHIQLHTLFRLAEAVRMAPADLMPGREEAGKPDIIDKRLLKETPLKEDQLAYVTTLVASGMNRKGEKENNRDV